MSSRKEVRYQLTSTKNSKLPVSTESGIEIQIDFSGDLKSKNITGELYSLIGIDRNSNWPVVQQCKSTETREVNNFTDSFIELYGVPEEGKTDIGCAFISLNYN